MAMKTITPGDAYDRRKFVDAMKSLSDLGVTAQNINTPEGSWNPDSRKDLGTLLKDDPTFYSGMSPDSVINDSQIAHKYHEKSIQNYAITNFSTLLGKVSGETLLQIVSSLPVDKTGDEGLDKAIRVINEKKKIAKVAKEGGIESYVHEKLANASDWRREAFFGYSVGNGNYTERTFQAYARSAEQDFARAVLEKDGKTINSAKLRRILEANYKKLIAKNTENADKVAEAYLSTIAQGAYQEVKPEKKDKPGSIARTGKVAA